MHSFSYDNIPFNAREQIRIFTLSPSPENCSTDPIEHDALINGSLESVNQTDNPEYMALSYVW
jgi:hypothetical protein